MQLHTSPASHDGMDGRKDSVDAPSVECCASDARRAESVASAAALDTTSPCDSGKPASHTSTAHRTETSGGTRETKAAFICGCAGKPPALAMGRATTSLHTAGR